MENNSEVILNQILNSKKVKLISELESIVLGKQTDYIPEVVSPKYFEISFYWAFDFKYIIIGKNNYVIDLSEKMDGQLAYKQFEEFRKGYSQIEQAEIEFLKIKQKLEFNFFAECWEELESRIGRSIRCFLIEHAIHRGIDVNKRTEINEEILEQTINEEGLRT